MVEVCAKVQRKWRDSSWQFVGRPRGKSGDKAEYGVPAQSLGDDKADLGNRM